LLEGQLHALKKFPGCGQQSILHHQNIGKHIKHIPIAISYFYSSSPKGIKNKMTESERIYGCHSFQPNERKISTRRGNKEAIYVKKPD
jgi:hypothetical protein